MSNEAYIHVRVNADEKLVAEEVLDSIGLNMATTIRLLLRQIAREQRVPLSLSLEPPANTYADALAARQARTNGHVGRSADEVIAEMERMVESAER